jgi:hypothetical protein
MRAYMMMMIPALLVGLAIYQTISELFPKLTLSW